MGLLQWFQQKVIAVVIFFPAELFPPLKKGMSDLFVSSTFHSTSITFSKERYSLEADETQPWQTIILAP